MEKLEHHLWIVQGVNALLTPLLLKLVYAIPDKTEMQEQVTTAIEQVVTLIEEPVITTRPKTPEPEMPESYKPQGFQPI